MKKILSLVLAISLCLSAVILLASCTGMSAYEVAVENGFVGTEQEWLASLKGEAGEKGKDGEQGEAGDEGYPGLPGDAGLNPWEDLKYNHNYMKTVEEWLASLKGADAKDGHSPVITVDTNGYWVIDGTRQPVKVDSSKVEVLSVELLEDTFSVVKSGEAPKLEIKVKLANGEEWILPVSNSVIAETSYDFTKVGTYPVTINYGGKAIEDTITVEGLMVYFENFDSLTNDAKMAEICAQAGFQIPVPSLEHSYTVPKVLEDGTSTTEKYKYSELYAEGIETWFLDGSDLTPYIIYGQLHRGNYAELKIENGRLVYKAHKNNGKIAGSTDSFLTILNHTEMAFAATDVYTLQMDIQVTRPHDNGTPENTEDDVKPTISISGNIAMLNKYFDDGSTGTSACRPVSIGSVFGAEYIMTNVYRKSSWYLGNGGKVEQAGLDAHGDQSLNILTSLFPDSTTGTWHGEEITIRMVVYPKTSDRPGYDVYVKKASDPETAFVFAGSFNAATTTATGMSLYLKEGNDGFAIQTRSSAINTPFYVDNIAAWTGNGNMPTNTSTSTYETLNEEYNATLTPAA